MFIRNATAPLSLKIAFQGLWFAKPRKRMLLNIFQQQGNTLHNLFVTRLHPIFTVFPGFLKQYYFHKSSMDTDCKLPSAISLSP